MKLLLLTFFSILLFSGTNKAQIVKAIPNGDFEVWSSQNIPDGWEADTSRVSTGISKSTDHYSGNYSVKLISNLNSSGPQLTSGWFDKFGGLIGGWPYSGNKDTLTGYYKYAPSPSGSDTGEIVVLLQKNGNFNGTGYHFYLFTSTSSWKYFEVPFSSPIVPDTMRIDLSSSVGFYGYEGSTLLIDNLKLKSQPHTSAIYLKEKPALGITSFPNPVQNQLNIRFNGDVPSEFSLKIFNSEGRLMIDNQYNSDGSTVMVPISQLSAGLYFYEVNANGTVVRNKFVKD